MSEMWRLNFPLPACAFNPRSQNKKKNSDVYNSWDIQ